MHAKRGGKFKNGLATGNKALGCMVKPRYGEGVGGFSAMSRLVSGT